MYHKAKAYYQNIDNTYTKTAEVTQRDKIDVEQTENIITIIHKKRTKKLLDFEQAKKELEIKDRKNRNGYALRSRLPVLWL